VPRSALPRLALALALLPGCALCEQLTATRVVTATLIRTPDMPDPEATDGSRLPEKVVVQVLLGDLQDGLTGAAAPISDAAVRIVFPLQPEGLEIPLKDEATGTYELDSELEPRVVYLAEQEYRIVIEDGDERVMKVTLPSDDGAGATLDPDVPEAHARGADFEIVHPDPENLAFATVSRFPNPTNASCVFADPSEIGRITYNSAPSDLEAVKKLIQDDGEWRADPVVIPGEEAFPDCGRYVVALSTMARGQAETSNLFIGSQFLAGDSAVGQLDVP